MTNEAAVLYVDDDPGNRTVFKQTFGRQYRVLVAEGGAEALEMLCREEKIAIVLTDQRMPDMSGNELLVEIKSKCPEIIRAIVTAYDDSPPVLEALNAGLAVRYVVKPWSLSEMEELLSWAVNRSRANERSSMDAILTRAGQTRALPEFVLEIVEVANNPKAGADELEDVIRREEAVSAKCLAVASCVAGAPPLQRVRDAVVRLGLAEVTQMALAVSLAGDWQRSSQSQRELWKHAMGAAVTAKALSRQFAEHNSTRMYVCGLLHDVGRILLLAGGSTLYADQAFPALSVERETYGFDHVDLGVVWAVRNGLGLEVIESILYHHEARASAWVSLKTKTRAAGIVAIAHHCVSQVLAADDTSSLDRFERTAPIMQWLRLRPDDVEQAVASAKQEYSRLLESLAIA